MKNNKTIRAVKCNSPSEFRKVFDMLHSAGYKKDGLPLFNVFVHDIEFDLGLRYVMIYKDSVSVKLAGSVDRKNTNIESVEANEFKINYETKTK